MRATNYTPILPPEEAHKHFTLQGGRLYKKLSSGAVTQLKSLDANLVVTLWKGTRFVGVDIAWCLIYGNWPEFPIVQIGADPLDFSESNLYPARVRRLRYVEKRDGLLYRHTLSSNGHTSPERCRRDWEQHAREFYAADMAYVLRMEAANRELRTKYLRETAAVRKPELPTQKPVRTSRPAAIAGREWHWWQDAWVDIPIACHVADDYRVRLLKQAQGAVHFAYVPSARMVFGYDANGQVVD